MPKDGLVRCMFGDRTAQCRINRVVPHRLEWKECRFKSKGEHFSVFPILYSDFSTDRYEQTSNMLTDFREI